MVKTFLTSWAASCTLHLEVYIGRRGTCHSPDPDGITVFDAVARELGLKLVKQRRSMPIIVVDHVDEKPIE
jgi:uncharacterized protein (TIGR03435 family)